MQVVNEVTSRVVSETPTGTTELIVYKDGTQTRTDKDKKGRNTFFQRMGKRKIYWSSHIWTDYADGSTTVHYQSSSKDWYTKHYDDDGHLETITNKDGEFTTIVDTSHRVLYCPESNLYLFMNKIMTEEETWVTLQSLDKVCPTVFDAIRDNPYKDRPFCGGPLTRLWNFILGASNWLFKRLR